MFLFWHIYPSKHQGTIPSDAKARPICAYYRRGQCRYGMSGKGCSRAHPSLCRKLMNNGNKHPQGCSKGKSCDKFHPKMCPSSIDHRECLNDECSMWHVKGTRRNNSRQPHLFPTHGTDTEQHPKAKREPHSNTQDSFLEILDGRMKKLMKTIDQRFAEIHQRTAGLAAPQPTHAAPPAAPLIYPTAVPQAVLLPGGQLMHQGAQPQFLRY